MSVKTKESKKIRDLIRIGVFSALWIAISWIIACTIGFFSPILMILPCVLALGGAVILVVMLAKVNTRGGIMISSFLFGICLFSMVPYGMLFFCTFAGGIIGEIIYNIAEKKSKAAKIIGITLPMLGIALGEYIPLCYMQDAFRSFYAEKITSPIGDAAMELINIPLVIILVLVTIICSVAGYFWGERIINKRMKNENIKNQ